MRLITKRIFKIITLLIVLILSWMSFIIIYYSPEYLTIEIQNICNEKLNIDNNTSIVLPKNWVYTISSKDKKSSLFYIPKDFILNDQLDVNKILFTVSKSNNTGIIEFKDKKYIEKIFKLYNDKYTIHDGKNCIYQVYQKDNKIDFIYIPQKKTKLNFKYYNKDIPKFIDELCQKD